MSLLREIQDAAIDSKIELATLLRKCKVLAARLGNEQFKEWVEQELNGYKSDHVPDYRKLHHVNSKGYFLGPFGSGLKNAPIPLTSISKDFRTGLDVCYLNQPVAELESLVRNAEGSLQQPWNPDLIKYAAQEIYEDMNCVQAWKEISKESFIATLDAVRNKILSFVLEIESENPAAGEAPLRSNPLPQHKVTQIFNNYILGGVQNLATANHNVKQKAKLQPGVDNEIFSKLLDTIAHSGADKQVIAQLTASVEEMRASRGSDFKAHYQEFVAILADHIQVFGPTVAQYLPGLAAFLR
jgi:hypothetical protein